MSLLSAALPLPSTPGSSPPEGIWRCECLRSCIPPPAERCLRSRPETRVRCAYRFATAPSRTRSVCRLVSRLSGRTDAWCEKSATSRCFLTVSGADGATRKPRGLAPLVSWDGPQIRSVDQGRHASLQASGNDEEAFAQCACLGHPVRHTESVPNASSKRRYLSSLSSLARSLQPDFKPMAASLRERVTLPAEQHLSFQMSTVVTAECAPRKQRGTGRCATRRPECLALCELLGSRQPSSL